MSDYGRPLQASERPSFALSLDLTRTARGAGPTNAELRGLLEKHGGNVAAVGRELGKARMQVHRWMERYGIDVDDFR
jgi:transcriptional regulator with GAF, ATPase, and Fis domain